MHTSFRTARQSRTAAAATCHGVVKYGFIDALRGYAVLLVITSHVGMSISELPFPVRKLTSFGWYGVQLFFLMSCVTLLMSWQSDRAKGILNLRHFWMRRVFRIAPMYYAAGLLYYWVMPPEHGFDLRQAVASALFVNAWHPVLMPTVAHAWSVVPGGWSVGVEFNFYIVFPVFALLVGTWRRAVLLVVVALGIAYVSTVTIEGVLIPVYGSTASELFSFYWFPHQLPVFALGAVLFHALSATWRAPDGRIAGFLRRHGTWVALACVAACAFVASLPFPGRMAPTPPLYVPRPYLASVIFVAFALALGNARASPFNNAWIRSLGRVSFSAYLLHFAVLNALLEALPGVFDLNATGYWAIATFALLCVCAVPIVYILALLTFTTIERPVMKLGRNIIERSRAATLG